MTLYQVSQAAAFLGVAFLVGSVLYVRNNERWRDMAKGDSETRQAIQERRAGLVATRDTWKPDEYEAEQRHLDNLELDRVSPKGKHRK